MKTTILAISDRGQITIPKQIRKELKSDHVSCTVEEQGIVLRPLRTREEFFADLEAAEKEWEEKGGIGLEDLKKKYDL